MNNFVRARDGIRLATDLYFPAGAASERYPVVLIRTPYGNFRGRPHNINTDAAVDFFASHGYVVAVQEIRGKFRSEGIFTVSGSEADDGYDTVDWLSRQVWSNGRVGTFGCSYRGDVQIFLAQTKHPALKAMIPAASGSAVGSAGQLYRYFGARRGGAIAWAASIGWFAENGQKITPKLPPSLTTAEYAANIAGWNQPSVPVLDYQRAWFHLPMSDALLDQKFPPSDFVDTITKPPSDPYWSKFPYMTDAYTSDVPALFVNSWYDFGADVTLFEYNWFRTHSVGEVARANQYAIMTPGVHCSSDREMSANDVVGARPMGDTRFDIWQVYLTWFDYWLKGSSEARKQIDTWPRLRYYLMGANAWKTADEWPLMNARPVSYFLSSKHSSNSLFGDGALSTSPSASRIGMDSYVYDPTNPVPSRGGAICCTGTVDATSGALDQRPVEARHDVLVYTSEPLASGVEVTGPVEAVLYVGSSAVDTDFTAKLVDVYPDGRAFNVLEGIARARYREGQDREVWMMPNRVYQIHIPIGVTSNYFGAGHRVRVEISSSNFPEFDRNLNVGGNNSTATDWMTATNVVYHSAQYPSRVVMPILAR